MTSADDVHGILAEIASQPSEQWKTLLEQRFAGRPAMVQQGLLWLRASREHAEDQSAPPSLGKVGDERYELMFRLASGTTASVWRARDRKLGRDVAIKVFVTASEGASHELMEARAACDVISDYVVRVLDVHDAGPRPYIVMELVAEHDAEHDDVAIGASASSCRPNGVAEVARWVTDVARGVRDAHLRNVFHRDLKPHNILITPISRRARTADFGLALSAANNQRGRTSSLLVKRGPSGPVSIAGTPEYMAPEQARGLPLHLDPLDVEERKALVAIDVWGLGALAFDLLGGRPPWLADRATDDEPWEIAATAAPPPAPHRMPDQTRIPAPLRHIVEKAMARAPEDRYTSAGQVVSELEAFLARRPTSLDRSYAQRAALWCRRNPQLTIAGVVAVVLAAMTLVTYTTVVGLRDERRDLSAEVGQQQAEETQMKARAAALRSDLDKTERQLKAEGQDLTVLETSLADEQRVYTALLAAKEKALKDANAATRELVDRLGTTAADLRRAEFEQKLYQGFWETARADADRASKTRDQAQADRDTARVERDNVKKERDERASERDQARVERDQGTREVARLTAALAAANARIATGERAAADRADPPVVGGKTAVLAPPQGSGSNAGSGAKAGSNTSATAAERKGTTDDAAVSRPADGADLAKVPMDARLAPAAP